MIRLPDGFRVGCALAAQHGLKWRCKRATYTDSRTCGEGLPADTIGFTMKLRSWLLILSCLGFASVSRASLAESPSALERSQASSGVRWHEWCNATLDLAAAQDRPVYVFVASELSGLSRATIAQTFSSERTVQWINESFFSIFVDEDRHPAVAAYAQHYINSVKQLKGSPVHLWLTPQMHPLDGANYLPPSEEWGRPGFLKAARSALDTFKTGPERVKALTDEAMLMMRLIPIRKDASIDVEERLARAAGAWTAAADTVNGGFGGAPKNPEPELIRFLVGRGGAAREKGVAAARALVNGRLRDGTDGGFNRRCIDEAWKEPYQQKLLVDQARIALALFDAADASDDGSLRRAAIGALEFALGQLKGDEGFAAALDGTLEGEGVTDKRPKFERVGRASSGSVALLAVALQRSGEARHLRAAKELISSLRSAIGADGSVPHIPGVSQDATPFDLAALALAMRSAADDATAGILLGRLNAEFLDTTTGRYMGTPDSLPRGIAFRPPAADEAPSAEALALLAGVDAGTVGMLRRGILGTIEYDDLPRGDLLLGLSR